MYGARDNAESEALSSLRAFAQADKAHRLLKFLLAGSSLNHFGPLGQFLVRTVVDNQGMNIEEQVFAYVSDSASGQRQRLLRASSLFGIDPSSLPDLPPPKPATPSAAGAMLEDASPRGCVLAQSPREFAVWLEPGPTDTRYGHAISFMPKAGLSSYYGSSYYGFTPPGTRNFALQTFSLDVLCATYHSVAITRAEEETHWLRTLGMAALAATPATNADWIRHGTMTLPYATKSATHCLFWATNP